MKKKYHDGHQQAVPPAGRLGIAPSLRLRRDLRYAIGRTSAIIKCARKDVNRAIKPVIRTNKRKKGGQKKGANCSFRLQQSSLPMGVGDVGGSLRHISGQFPIYRGV